MLKLAVPGEEKSKGAANTGWFVRLNASVRKFSFHLLCDVEESFDAVIFQTKYGGAIEGILLQIPTSPVEGLQKKPPGTAGVQPPSCGADGAPVPSGLSTSD